MTTSKPPSKPPQKSDTPKNDEENAFFGGPKVARKNVPKSLQTGGKNDDGLMKRAALYLSSHFVSFGSVAVFFLICLALIFSVLIVMRGFLCVDVIGAINANDLAWYCRKV